MNFKTRKVQNDKSPQLSRSLVRDVEADEKNDAQNRQHGNRDHQNGHILFRLDLYVLAVSKASFSINSQRECISSSWFEEAIAQTHVLTGFRSDRHLIQV
jgi:hypothetical protein